MRPGAKAPIALTIFVRLVSAMLFVFAIFLISPWFDEAISKASISMVQSTTLKWSNWYSRAGVSLICIFAAAVIYQGTLRDGPSRKSPRWYG
jgi:type II secretory pathway component PulF